MNNQQFPSLTRTERLFLAADAPTRAFSNRFAPASLPAMLTAGLWACGVLMLSAAPLLSPSDRVIGIDLDSGSGYPGGEAPPYAIDANSGTKYLNFSHWNAGIIINPGTASVAQSLVLTTANDAPERNPASYLLFGSNYPIASADNSNGFTDHWTFISSGNLNLPTAPFVTASPVNFTNSASFTSYWLVFTSTRNWDTIMQIGDIQLYTGTDGTGSGILASGNPTLATAWQSWWPSSGEAPEKVVDGTPSKYLNFGKENSGFIVIPAAGATVINSFVLTTGGDAEGRDPASWILHGQAKNGQWSEIGSGTLSLPGDRNTPGAAVPVTNTTAYVAYRMVFPAVKNAGENSMQIAEAQFYGTILPANDTDSDGMDDAWETQHGLIVGTNDSAGDLDIDGSTNLDEYRNVTLPNNPDTDGDGFYDGVETLTGIWVSVSNTGTDPLKADTDSDGYPDKYEADRGTDPNSAAAVPTLAWDLAPGTVGAGDSAITGGAGTWDLSSGNWTTDGGATNFAWNNSGPRLVGIFGGTAGGAVTLGGDITTDGIILNTTGYSFAGNTLTLSGPKPTITTGNGVTAEISSPLSGTAGLTKNGPGALTLSGTGNSLTGTFTLGGTGKIVLAKTSGLALGGNINLSSTAWNGNNSGVVLGGDEQIADTSVLTWTTIGQADSFFRLNGHTETIGGLVSTGVGGFVVIENRGYLDTADYGTGTVIINTTGTNTYTYNGFTRDRDGGTGGGAIALTKTGTGTQILTGGPAHSGPTTVNGGVLQVNGTLDNSPVTVTATGTLSGTGTLGAAVTVQGGGTLAPGINGVGTLTAGAGVTLGTGGTLTGAGSFNGGVTVGSGGILASTGTVSGTVLVQADGTLAGTATLNGAVTVQAGGTLAPAAGGIGNLRTTNTLSLAGDSKFDLNKSGATLTCDTVSGYTAVTYGGTLTVTASGDELALGDSFQLFVPGAGATISGSFASLALPPLPTGMSWETVNLLTAGELTVVNYVGTPLFNPAAGGYIGAQSVTITSDSGSTIFYTTDGSTPTASSASGLSPLAGIPIPLDAAVTLKAFARKAGQTDSPVATAVYHTVATATWNVDANGLWSDTANWLNQVSPNSLGAPVDFTYPQGADTTVTLDGSRSAGNLTFGNINNYNWNIAASGTSALTLGGAAMPTITVLDSTTTIAAGIAGFQGLAKAGPGTLVLNGVSSYAGTTAINGGVIRVNLLTPNGNNSGLGSGSAMTLNGGTLRYTGTSVNFGNFGRAITLEAGGGTLDAAFDGYWFTTGVISGSGPLTKTGGGQLIIQATNTYDGITYLNQGEIQLRSLGALGSTLGQTIVADGARLCAGGGLTGTVDENLELNGSGGNASGALQANDGGTVVTYAGNLTLASDSGVGSTGGIAFTISGAIGGPGGLTKLNNNAVTLAGSASNSYGGITTLGGTGKLVLAKTGGALAIPGDINISSTAWNGNGKGIVLAADEQIADSAVITWTSGGYGGTLRLNGHTEMIGGLNSTATGLDPEIENRGYEDPASYGTGTLIINTTGSNVYSFNGGIRDMDAGTGGGAIALVKQGTGTQILNGGTTYTGTTSINGGILEVDTNGYSAMTVAPTATLKGSGSTTGTVAISSGGTLAPGINVGTFAAGSTTLAGTYACEVDGATGDRLTVTGSLDLTGATLAITPLADPTASYVIASYTTTLTGTFATVTGLPVGYTVHYDATAKQIRLLKFGYDSWAVDQGLTAGVNDGKTQDPDGDGVTNLMEYALGGNPLLATDKGVSAAGLRDVAGVPALTLTIAARTGASFAEGPNHTMEAVVDGIRYRVESAVELATWTGTITEIAPLSAGLPPVPAGYVYHTFRTAGPVASTPADFIRLQVSDQL